MLTAAVFVLLALAARGDDATAAQAAGNGRVTIVYQDDAILPANREAIAAIRELGVFERMAERLTKTVALPHDLEVIVTDRLPEGVDVATAELDGRRIFWPAGFSKETYDVLAEALPAVRDKGRPKAIAEENFTAEVLNVWGNQFILAMSSATPSSTSSTCRLRASRKFPPTVSEPSSR